MNALEQLEGDLLFGGEKVSRLPRDETVVADRIVEQRRQASGKRRVVASRERSNAARIAIASPNSKWFAARPRRSDALSMAGKSSRMSDDVCTSSTAPAAASACVDGPPHSSAESSVSTGRTRFDGAKSV